VSPHREGSKTQSRHDAASPSVPRVMAHPDPRVVQSSRYMAHPVHFVRLRKKLAGATSRFGGASSAITPRLLPKSQRHRDLAVVIALLTVAAIVAASLPGGWVGPSAASLSASASASGQTATAGQSESTPGPFVIVPTAVVPPILPAELLTPTLPPWPTPTPTPTKAPHTYSFVALGDSLTAWPTSGPWPDRLGSIDSNLRLIHNAGVPGNLTSDMLDRASSDVFAYKPEVMFLLGGTNDVGRNVSQATTIANMRTIVVAARAKGIKVFMMTIPPNSNAGMAADIDSMNAAIVHLANSYAIVCIDIHAVLSTSTGVYIPKYTSDGLHFNDLGALVVASAIYSRIHRLGY
jgi:lysophospholipase L1-like esterase